MKVPAWILMSAVMIVIGTTAEPATGQPPGDARFVMARLRYSGGGDWYGNETSWVNLLAALDRRTTLSCARKEATVGLQSNDLFYYPFVTLTGHGTIQLSDDEADRLRRYLVGGGFLWADDDYGLDASLRAALKKVFPEADLVELPRDHAIYRTVYELRDGLPKIHEHAGGPPRGYGLFHEGRMVVFYSHNTDIGDGLEDADVHGDPPEKREAAMKMAINIVIHALSAGARPKAGS
jgi:hypothetical protein